MNRRQTIFTPLSEAGPLVEELIGECPHPSTLSRWASTGIAGVRLQTVFARGTRRTTSEWLQQFFHEVAEAKANKGKPEVSKSPANKRPQMRDAATAKEFLMRDGC